MKPEIISKFPNKRRHRIRQLMNNNIQEYTEKEKLIYLGNTELFISMSFIRTFIVLIYTVISMVLFISLIHKMRTVIFYQTNISNKTKLLNNVRLVWSRNHRIQERNSEKYIIKNNNTFCGRDLYWKLTYAFRMKYYKIGGFIIIQSL